MSAKISAARRAAFLKALAETESLTLSAGRARVNKDWSLWHRKRDPGFAAACREAVAAAKVSIDATRDARGMVPPSGWGSLDGVELVVRGAPGRRAQIRRARVDGWSPTVEDRFLATLAAMCNVKAACAEIGMTQASAYYHRQQWPGFAKQWDADLATGYIRLEFALVENAKNIFSGNDSPRDNPMPPVTWADALALLRLHRHRVHGVGKRSRPRGRDPTIEQVQVSIMRKIEAIERGERLSEAVRAKDAAEHARRRGSG